MKSPVQTVAARGLSAFVPVTLLCLGALALPGSAGCGRVGVDLLSLDVENICIANYCSDDFDRCPTDEGKNKPAICGCGVSDLSDADQDGTPDCDDMCAGAPDKLSGGRCGCPAASEDADDDGVANCLDRCPADAAKQGPGVCGCGEVDEDSDGDTMPDCADQCPEDAAKVVPGNCGCGLAESTRDHDQDGRLDCVDLCNGIDDARYVPDATCGQGYCRTNNTPSSCSNAVETACRPGDPLSNTDMTCDGVDDDCDGQVDDDFPSYSTTCGRGACATEGSMTCVNGQQRDTCAPLPAAANDATCGGDDDCDGMLDEDFTPYQSTCGFGVCMNTGTVTCLVGVPQDSCTPRAPTLALDTTCNGLDENCSGESDENYVQTPTACGTGACARMGMMTCIEGAPYNTCVPGPAGADDLSCNGVDDDCNGTRDDGYVPVPSQCGVGACRRTGMVNCVSGATQDTCRPGNPAAADTVCNGIDDDCDEGVDEDYITPTSTCGDGICQRSGMVLCTAGRTMDTCVPGTTSATQDGPPANGLDDDCDGVVDEDACVDRTPRTFGPGSHTIAAPAGCLTANVQLWGGGGGGGGQSSVGTTGTPGTGGAGGYAAQAVPVTGALNLYVGNGGSGCGAGGTNAGASTYNGGNGGANGASGQRGNDGAVAGGGTGGNGGASAGNGGRGHFGGGGGGAGIIAPWPPYPGEGGGGGAASVFLVAGTRAVTAGGGGGGGGANGSSPTSRAGNGGEGCGRPGQSESAGGGGGGGMCQGTTVTPGNGTTPPNAGSLPAGRAVGGNADCGAGGAGYAIVTFSR